jgi:hypothetical protein
MLDQRLFDQRQPAGFAANGGHMSSLVYQPSPWMEQPAMMQQPQWRRSFSGYAPGLPNGGLPPNRFRPNSFAPNGFAANNFDPNGLPSSSYPSSGFPSNSFPPNDGAAVVLHIYDLGRMKRIQFGNRLMRIFGTGAYHAAVEVYGVEWSFGAKQAGSGIFDCPPRSCSQHTYRKPLLLGHTPLSEEQVYWVIEEMSQEWPGRSYDLLQRNCTHFTAAFAERLGVGQPPPYIYRLAAAGARIDEIRQEGQEARLSGRRSAMCCQGSCCEDWCAGLREEGQRQRGGYGDERIAQRPLDRARGCCYCLGVC